MRKLIACTAVTLAALLSACSHGGTLPGAQSNVSPADALHQKELREEQRLPGTFVAPKRPGYMAEAPSAQSWPSGIQEAGQAPVPGGIFAIVNQYNTSANGKFITVYAGSLKTTGAGVLLVVSRSPDLHNVTAQTYTVAPSAVRIAGVSNGQLQLETTSAQPQRIPFRIPL
jgi:hypothetical protein